MQSTLGPDLRSEVDQETLVRGKLATDLARRVLIEWGFDPTESPTCLDDKLRCWVNDTTLRISKTKEPYWRGRNGFSISAATTKSSDITLEFQVDANTWSHSFGGSDKLIYMHDASLELDASALSQGVAAFLNDKHPTWAFTAAWEASEKDGVIVDTLQIGPIELSCRVKPFLVYEKECWVSHPPEFDSRLAAVVRMTRTTR